MRATSENSFFRIFFWAALSLCLAPVLVSADYTQEGAQKTAANMNNNASDDSLEASSTNVMMAVMNLSALNIPGAFSHGYKAYGQYINSEKLDDMEAHAQANKGGMASLGSATRSSSAVSAARATTFSRLDPGYLRQGDAAQVAEEFEKRSGMSREEFLRQLGGATDSDLTYDDPSLLQKLEARFQQFVSAVPNKDFKKGLETAAAMLPSSARSQALAKLASFYADAYKGSEPASMAVAQAPAETTPSAIVPEAATAATEETRAPASTATGEPMLKSQAFLGLGQNPDALKDLLASADSTDEQTLFDKVSQRYRLLTPELLSQH